MSGVQESGRMWAGGGELELDDSEEDGDERERERNSFGS